MGDWIKSLTGKTFRAKLSELRAARKEPPPAYDDVVSELDALANQAASAAYNIRAELNRLRLVAVRAKQTVIRLQRLKRPDIEL